MKKRNEILKYAGDMALMGFACGLEPPIEWYINARRIAIQVGPYEEAPAEIEKYFQALKLFYEYRYMKRNATDEEVMEWIKNYYAKENKQCLPEGK